MPEPRHARGTKRPPIARCAIYTRKSSEEGLEQDFNSLHAQREACEAYIASQKHEGWVALPTCYDDGGLSGGTMERPALQRLLQDIENGEIDVIVVYKVDRLTRALSDFAKIVEVFDRQEVSFVSVTQQFNTTTSMGRLTLNVLLSFAQFEREVTGERIRDKIAASKKKGMWMGGNPPLGYDVADRKLVVNEEEAETVLHIFRLYCRIKSVRELRHRLEVEGIHSKRRIMRDGSVTGGKPINRGALYHLLQNRIYLGEIVHKDKSFPGKHDAIVERDLWDEVQAILAGNITGKRQGTAGQPSLLTGLLIDEQGERLSPSHAVKQGRRYRYYVSRHLIVGGKTPDRKGWRIPAADLENLVLARIRAWLSDPAALSEAVEGDAQDASAQLALITSASMLAQRWPDLSPREAKAYLSAFVSRIVVRRNSVTIEINPAHVVETILVGPAAARTTKCGEGSGASEHPIALEIPAALKRTGTGIRLVIQGTEKDARPDHSLIRLMVRAFAIREKLDRDPNLTMRQIAVGEGVVSSYVTRLLRLTYLAPDIVTAIVEGRQPIELMANRLMDDTRLPLEWQAQRELLGFAAAR